MPPASKRSLSRDLSISVFLLVFILQIPLVFYYFTREARQISTSFRSQTEENAQRLTDVLAVPLWHMDIPQLERIAIAFTQNDPMTGIRILDIHGHVFFDSIQDKNPDPSQMTSMNIRNNGNTIGSMDLYLSREPYKKDLARLRNQTLWVLGLSLMAIYIGIGLLSRLFMKPLLKSLSESLKHVGNGRFDHAFTRVRHREMETLASTIQDMASRIKARENVLQMMNKELQAEVKERKKAEEEALNSEARRKALLDAIPDMIFQFDRTGAFLDFQGDKTQLFIDADKFLHKQAHEVLPEHISALIEKNIERALDTHKPIVFEYSLYMGKENSEYFEARMVAATKDTVLAIVRNISGRVRAEAQRKKLESQLTKAQKMEAVGMLAGGVAHDLNNVLSGLVSYPDLLLQDLPEDSTMHRRIRIIQKSGQRAAQIVEDLLTLARRGVSTENGIQMNAVILDYLSTPEHEKLCSFHPEVRIHTSLSPDLDLIRGSGLHLGKMIMNLVSNAAEAMPEGGQIFIETSKDIKTSEVFPHGAILIRIQDTGMGIAPEDKEKIFEPFYTKKVMGRSGTGLGMAVVWSTVQDHHGQIFVDSEPGKGCTISIYLPVTPGLFLCTEEEDYSPEGSGEHILVVDDLPEQREISTLILEKLGYRVTTVSSGEEALAGLQSLLPDLVLLDMIMGPKGMDGLECFCHMRSLLPDLKILLVTGFSENERTKEALALGAMGLIKKPYTFTDLARNIHRAICETG
ncbi:hybrid sensor histidine kinase/response regulator [Desulfobotulus mexicanus]|uniref:histidine kinase n=1 Tax=Desulfobotulus mexicanus TaxID=2586642 RepID=A0A5Q4VEP8_9BACT|nr:ATP-binding protein [Desulfobotulus mexicanus]TYT74867.1 response regulator [Desulfobotulus mexicanus]